MEVKVLVSIELGEGTKNFLEGLVANLNKVTEKSPEKSTPKTQGARKPKSEEIVKEDTEEISKEETPVEIVEEQNKITIDDLRVLMADACKAGKKVEVAECLKSCGGARLSEINEDDYAKLAERVKKL